MKKIKYTFIFRINRCCMFTLVWKLSNVGIWLHFPKLNRNRKIYINPAHQFFYHGVCLPISSPSKKTITSEVKYSFLRNNKRFHWFNDYLPFNFLGFKDYSKSFKNLLPRIAKRHTLGNRKQGTPF